MKFCCATLSYNQGQYLEEALESVLTQKVELDYIVYDPGSTDLSRQIILSKESEVLRKYFVEGDAGPAQGLNRCLDAVDGEIFYYLNADDRLLPETFSYVSEYFSNNLSCDVLHGSIRLINEFGHIARILPAMKFTLRGYALGYSVVYQQATFIRKSIIPKDAFNIQNQISWDGELIVDLCLAGAEIHQTQKILGDFRIYPDSITGSGRLADQAKIEHRRITRKILGRDAKSSELVLGMFYAKILALLRRIRYARLD